MTVENISKDKYQASLVKRSSKSFLTARTGNLPDEVLEKVLEWRLISETELAASESAEGTLVSQGTNEWTIDRRSIPAGIYQVKFDASYKVGDPAFPQTLEAFDYGFIEVIAAPLRAIIDGGSSARWGSVEAVTVDGSLSYDEDIGPGNHTGLNFAWSCFVSGDNASASNDCFDSFVGQPVSTTITVDPSYLGIGTIYVLILTVSKDNRKSIAEMSFEIAHGEIPQVTLRYIFPNGS